MGGDVGTIWRIMVARSRDSGVDDVAVVSQPLESGSWLAGGTTILGLYGFGNVGYLPSRVFEEVLTRVCLIVLLTHSL